MSHQEPISKTFTLQERIAQWREQEALANADESTHSGMYSSGRAFAFGRCADEAELIVKEALTAAALPGRAQASPDLESIKSALASTSRGFQYRRTVKGEPQYRTAKDDLALLVTECESLRAQLASADAAVQEPSPWQPIATLPDDVEFFIAAWACEGAPSGYDVGEVMRDSNQFYALMGTLAEPPVYWRPLPAAPLPATEPQK